MVETATCNLTFNLPTLCVHTDFLIKRSINSSNQYPLVILLNIESLPIMVWSSWAGRSEAFSFHDMLQKMKQLFQMLCFSWLEKIFSSENKSKFIKSTALRRDTAYDYISRANVHVIKEQNLESLMVKKNKNHSCRRNECPVNIGI